jgi:alpha-1,2-mannosyltransferase
MSCLALANNFRFGQWYLVIAFAMAYSFRKYREGNRIAPGIAIGLTGIVKYFPFVFLMIPLMRREFRTIWMCLLATITGILCTMTLTGSDVFIQFISGSAVQHASGLIQDPFSSTFQSWGSLSRRLFVFDADLNSHPLLDSRALYLFFHYGTTAFVALATLGGILRLRRFSEQRAMDFQFVLLCVGGLLASPATATYHMLILVLPVGILLLHSSEEKGWNIFFALTYASIGFLPYSLFKVCEGMGILSVIAYPRLWILATLFVGTLLYAEHAFHSSSSHTVTNKK